jgi:hypothetical protein
MTTPNLPNGFNKILGLLIKNIKWVAIFILIVAVISNIATCNQKNSWQAKYKTYYDSTRAELVRSDSLERSARKFQLSADSAKLAGAHQTQVIQTTAGHLAKMRDSTAKMQSKLDSLVQAGGQTSSAACQQCFLVNHQLHLDLDTAVIHIGQLEKRDTTRLVEIGNLRVALHTDTLNINQLQHTIDMTPKPQVQRLFWTLNLTPNQSFLAGVITTAVAIITTGGKL